MKVATLITVIKIVVAVEVVVLVIVIAVVIVIRIATIIMKDVNSRLISSTPLLRISIIAMITMHFLESRHINL